MHEDGTHILLMKQDIVASNIEPLCTKSVARGAMFHVEHCIPREQGTCPTDAIFPQRSPRTGRAPAGSRFTRSAKTAGLAFVRLSSALSEPHLRPWKGEASLGRRSVMWAMRPSQAPSVPEFTSIPPAARCRRGKGAPAYDARMAAPPALEGRLRSSERGPVCHSRPAEKPPDEEVACSE